jgi:hypothetical protein
MTAWMLLGLALAAKPELGFDPAKPTPAWLVGGHAPLTRTPRWDDCAYVPIERAGTLPAGVKVVVWLREDDKCREPILLVSFVPQGWPHTDRDWFVLPREAITFEAPKRNPWAEAPAVREAFLGYVHPHPFVLTQSLGDLSAQPITPFAEGDRVQVLHEGLVGVFRAPDGRTFATPGQRMREVDRDPYASYPDSRALRDRLLANRPAHETVASLGFPPADGLQVPRDQGRAFSFEVRREDLDHPVYEAAWLEPVGQRYTHTCGARRQPEELCGRYYLDYSAFGAWRPDKSWTLLAQVEGTRVVDGETLPVLKVLVKDPWSSGLRVSPSW